jgi:hypothetical protein
LVHKLGPAERVERARERGVTHVICPYRSGFEQFIRPVAPDMTLLWIPVAPEVRIDRPMPLACRRAEVLCHGHLWAGEDGFRPYEMRRWAVGLPCVETASHALDGGYAQGPRYQGFLEQYAGALALCDTYVVPKYLEIPLAGCVCFCQMLPEYAEMGFEDGVNCIAVDRYILGDVIETFRDDPEACQGLADAGRALAMTYSAGRFSGRLRSALMEIGAVAAN